MFGGAFGIWQWVIVLVIVLVLFGGRGKISGLMGDFGKGLRSFKKGMKGEEAPSEGSGDETKSIDSDAASREDVSEKDKTTQS